MRCALALAWILALACDGSDVPPPEDTVDPVACKACGDANDAEVQRCASVQDGCVRTSTTIEARTRCLVTGDRCTADAFDVLAACELKPCSKAHFERWSCTADCWRTTAVCEQAVGDRMEACVAEPSADFMRCSSEANAGLTTCTNLHNRNCLPACPP